MLVMCCGAFCCVALLNSVLESLFHLDIQFCALVSTTLGSLVKGAIVCLVVIWKINVVHLSYLPTTQVAERVVCHFFF